MSADGCRVPDCGEPHHSHGLCHRHAEKWRRQRRQDPHALRPGEREEVKRGEWVREWLGGWQCGRALFGRLAPWAYESEPAPLGPIVTSFKAAARDEIEADWAIHGEQVLEEAERKIAAGRLPKGYRPYGQRVAESARRARP